LSKPAGEKPTREGLVVSDKMDKTIVVRLERTTRHPLYGKVLRRGTKVKVHDEDNDARVGDVVSITECRPLSKEKAWRMVSIVRRAR